MRHRVSPRWQSPIGPQKVAVPGLEPHLMPFPDRFPLDGRVEPRRKSLEDFAASHAEKEGLVGGGEVLAEAALESDDVVGSGDVLDGPLGGLGGAVAVLDDGIFVFVG